MNKYIGYLFMDIETVPIVQFFNQLDERLQNLFRKRWKKEIDELADVKALILNVGKKVTKAEQEKNEVIATQEAEQKIWEDKAGLSAEYGRIACVSIGSLLDNKGVLIFRVRAITSADEGFILAEVAKVMAAIKGNWVVGHNFKSFDGPILARKFVMHRLPIPYLLDMRDKKPWEGNQKDTMEIWGFGEYKKTISLDLLAASLGLPSPKDVMDGSEVQKYFYTYGMPPEQTGPSAEGLQKIGEYCNKDVVTCAKCFLILNGEHGDFPEIL